MSFIFCTALTTTSRTWRETTFLFSPSQWKLSRNVKAIYTSIAVWPPVLVVNISVFKLSNKEVWKIVNEASQWRILGGFWSRARRADLGKVVKIDFRADFGIFGHQSVENTPGPIYPENGFFQAFKMRESKNPEKNSFWRFWPKCGPDRPFWASKIRPSQKFQKE